MQSFNAHKSQCCWYVSGGVDGVGFLVLLGYCQCSLKHDRDEHIPFYLPLCVHGVSDEGFAHEKLEDFIRNQLNSCNW